MKIKISGLNVRGISAVVPKDILPMSAFYESVGEQEIKRVVMSTGITSVHIAGKKTRASDLCEKAAIELFKALKIDPLSIDGIVFVSQTPDFKMPATSCSLQDRLCLKKEVVAFDINYGCSGYIYGLYQAAVLVKAGGCDRVLVCAGDTITHYLNAEDYKVKLVFGDAGSATLVEKGDEDWAFDIFTDGSGYEQLIIPKNNVGSDACLLMNGGAIMEFALREVMPVFEQVLALQGWTREMLSKVVLHQANEFILNYLRKKLDLDPKLVPIDVKRYGNTGPASIPLTLCGQYARIGEEMLGKSVLVGFGAGLSWGACALDLAGCQLLDVIEY